MSSTQPTSRYMPRYPNTRQGWHNYYSKRKGHKLTTLLCSITYFI